MKAILITFLLIAMAAGSSMARPEDASSTTESIAELEDDLDTDNSTEIISDDVHCEEVEKLKDFYCTTAHCKHFYSKHCYLFSFFPMVLLTLGSVARL